MRHVRMLGLCLVAICALAAYAVSSASALPEWGKCEAKAKGKYANSNCTTKAKKGSGAFEWTKGKKLPNDHFTGSNPVGGSGGVLYSRWVECDEGTNEKRLESRKKCEEGGGKVVSSIEAYIECESEQNIGETHSTKEVINVRVAFKGCKALGTIPCSNTATEGEIAVNPLKGELGYINKAEHKVGVLLTPQKAKGDFAEFNCEGLGISLVVGVGNKKEGAWYSPESHGGYDGIISPITPVNQMGTETEQVYTVTSPEDPENIPSKFEGKHIDVLESFGYNNEDPESASLMWGPAGEEITNVNTAAEEREIKA